MVKKSPANSFFKNFDVQKVWELVETQTRSEFTMTTVLKVIDELDSVLWGSGELNINNTIREYAMSAANAKAEAVDPDGIEREMEFYLSQVYINPHVVLEHLKLYNKRKRRHKVVISSRALKAIILRIVHVIIKVTGQVLRKEGLC